MAKQCQPSLSKEELTALLRKQHFGCVKIFQVSTSVCVGRRNDTETLGMQGGGEKGPAQPALGAGRGDQAGTDVPRAVQ